MHFSQAQDVFINEIHYDNTGTDVNEGVELAGLAETDITGWQLIPYNGNGGAPYSPVSLSGSIPNQQSGFGTIFIPIAGLQNGSPDGIALVDASDQVVQFISYEGSFTAVGGPADGMTSEDIGITEESDTPVSFSLQLSGTGNQYEDFTWASPALSTYNNVNSNQVFSPLEDVVFINEIHYDNVGTDTDEGVELAGNTGVDLAGWTLVGYNGSNGLVYTSTDLMGTIDNQQNGYGTLFFPIEGLQNGSPDGFALLNADSVVVQFLSYEGSFMAVDGPAAGTESEDIGVAEASDTPQGFSLQLSGKGFAYYDFVWSEPAPYTYNSVNAGQSFGDMEPEPDPDPVVVTIAEARTLPVGTEVIINGTLTVSDQLGGPAYIQDSTGGIPLFDPQVHMDSLFEIGDSLQVTASLGAFNEQVQLVEVTEIVSFGTATLPVTPKVVNIAAIDSLEGQLVTIPDVFFINNEGLFFPENNYVISDGTGALALRVDGDLDSLPGREIPDDTVSITGVLGSFRGTLQLFPRFMEDLPGTEAYLPEGLDIPTSATLDVMTWNMEFFGATQKDFGPADIQLQIENAYKVLDSVRADIIAVQEISDEVFLAQLVSDLPGYALICSDRYSYSFEGPDPDFPAQQLCFMYDTTAVKIIGSRVMFESLYDSARAGNATPLDSYPTGDPSSFWSSGRLPYIITAEVYINGEAQTIQLINIHAKSGAGSNDISRKYFDVKALKDTLDQYYANDNIILLGDYNDDVDESIGGGTSPYAPFVIAEDFKVVTATLSEEGLRSFIFNDNVIDHITISNELYEEFLPGTETLFIPFSFIDNYANTTSDHLPVITRFEFVSPFIVDAGEDAVVYSGYDPLACTTLSVGEISGGNAPFTYSWNNGSGEATTEVCPEEGEFYVLTVTDAAGRVSSDSVRVCVIDVSCGDNSESEKVQACVNRSGDSGKGRTFCVPKAAVKFLLARGASLGSCGVSCEEAENETPKENKQNIWSDFQVYPNPIIDHININFKTPVSGTVEVIIHDQLGRVVFSKGVAVNDGRAQLDITRAELSNQFYYLQIRSEGGQKLVRILKK